MRLRKPDDLDEVRTCVSVAEIGSWPAFVNVEKERQRPSREVALNLPSKARQPYLPEKAGRPMSARHSFVDGAEASGVLPIAQVGI